MSRLLTVLALSASIAAPVPVAAQSLTTLLPSLSFPETVTPSTKGCGESQAATDCTSGS
jgi:hypothetical protein